MIRKKAVNFLILSAALCCITAPKICHSETFGPMPQSKDAAEAPEENDTPKGNDTSEENDTPEENDIPEENAALEGEGTLSPPTKSTEDSVFGKASAQEAVTDEKMEALLSQLQPQLPAGNGSWSVYVSDLFKESEGSINDHRMQAASLIKLYIMGAVYENYDNLIQQYGQGTIDSYLNSMITVSDNDSANALVGCLGGGDSSAGMGAVNAFCMAHGYSSTSMGRLLLQSNASGDNYTSVSDCGHFMKAVYDGNSEEYPYADSMLSLLSAQTRRNKIPAQLPPDVSVANKTGELSDVENDAGIIYNELNDLIIVFMSENLTEAGAAQSTIASLSRQIYDYYNS